jgi:hypothetical protein
MNISICKQDKHTVYIKSEKSLREGGFCMVAYKDDRQPQPTIGYDGPKEYQRMCFDIAKVLLKCTAL